LEEAVNWKIVMVGLAATLLISVHGIAAQQLNRGTDILTAQAPSVTKASGPVVFTERSGPIVR
jgi:hypothetical protein